MLSASVLQRLTTRPKRRQVQKLTVAEAEAFEGLMSIFIPEASKSGLDSMGSLGGALDNPLGMGGRTTLPDGLQVVQDALNRKIGEREVEYSRKAVRNPLTRREEERLDEMQEIMAGIKNDYELLQWSMKEIFGYPDNQSLFPDPRTSPAIVDEGVYARTGPTSAIYPDLLLTLFLLLRDTHKSPHSALNIFSLACLTPQSFVAGCTTALYNEVLRTRWMEGDVESVAQSLDEMRSAGIRINDGTKDIVQAIGEAIRVDESRAEERVLSPEATISEQQHHHEYDRNDPDSVVNRYRFFSKDQIASWVRMDTIIEENIDDKLRKKRDKDEEDLRDWQERKLAKYGSSSSSPEMSNGNSSRREVSFGGQRDTRAPTGTSRRDPSSLSKPRIELEPAARIDSDQVMEEDDSMIERSGADNKMRSDSYFNDENNQHNEEGIHSSWDNFSPRDQPTPRADRTPADHSNDRFDDRGSERRSALPGQSVERSSSSSSPATNLSSSDDSLQDDRAENDDKSTEDGEEFYYEPESPEPEKRIKRSEEVVLGSDGLPRRPSSLNPFKIRRAGLTKLEKAKRDTPHPLLFWKAKK